MTSEDDPSGRSPPASSRLGASCRPSDSRSGWPLLLPQAKGFQFIPWWTQLLVTALLFVYVVLSKPSPRVSGLCGGLESGEQAVWE